MTITAQLQSRIARRSNSIAIMETALTNSRKSMKTYGLSLFLADQLKEMRADQVLDKQLKQMTLGATHNQKVLDQIFA
jgi:HD superfamily phosphohydrolase YqeK